MIRASSTALAAARPVLRGLVVLNLLYAAAIAVLLVASLLMPGLMDRALGLDMLARFPHVDVGLRVIVVIGVIGAAIVHVALRRLLAIVETVRVGDPFILDNARRLHAIALCVLALELLRLLVMGIAAAVWEPGRLGGVSLAPWLAVLMLFVLSGVFAQGARMRSDLEGTV